MEWIWIKNFVRNFLMSCVSEAQIQKIPIFGVHISMGAAFVVSMSGTPQAFLEPLQDPAPTFSNTNISIIFYKITKTSKSIAEYGQYRRNFDDIPQMSKYWPNMRHSDAN